MSKYTIFKYVDDSVSLHWICSCEKLTDAIHAYYNLNVEHLVFLYDAENRRVLSSDLIEYMHEHMHEFEQGEKPCIH